MSADVVESVNYIFKKGYNGHSARGGGARKSAVEREAMVVQQVWEWWFLTFDLPFLHYNTAAPPLHFCEVPPKHPPPTRLLRPSADSSPIHGRRRNEEAARGEPEGDTGPGGMLSVAFILRS